MIEIIEKINGALNTFIWGVPAIVAILGVGLYLSIRTGFVQIRKFGVSMRETIGKLFKKGDTSRMMVIGPVDQLKMLSREKDRLIAWASAAQ